MFPGATKLAETSARWVGVTGRAPARRAHQHCVGVAQEEAAFPESDGSAVADHAIPLHFAELDAPHVLPVLDWLPREGVHGTATPPVLDLVFDHVVQALVECGSYADERVESHPRGAVGHGLAASSLVFRPEQREGERYSDVDQSVSPTNLGSKHLGGFATREVG